LGRWEKGRKKVGLERKNERKRERKKSVFYLDFDDFASEREREKVRVSV